MTARTRSSHALMLPALDRAPRHQHWRRSPSVESPNSVRLLACARAHLLLHPHVFPRPIRAGIFGALHTDGAAASRNSDRIGLTELHAVAIRHALRTKGLAAFSCRVDDRMLDRTNDVLFRLPRPRLRQTSQARSSTGPPRLFLSSLFFSSPCMRASARSKRQRGATSSCYSVYFLS